MHRRLYPQERDLVAALLANSATHSHLVAEIEHCLVEQMNDGGMGSLRFVSNAHDRRFGGALAEASFLDTDGVLVSVALNVDRQGQLFELDIWKVDFSPLKHIPGLADIQIVAPVTHGR